MGLEIFWNKIKTSFNAHFLVSEKLWLSLPADEAERHRKSHLVRFICLLMGVITQTDNFGNLSVLFTAINQRNPGFDYKTEIAFDVMEQGLVFALFFMAFSNTVNAKNYYRIAVILAIAGFVLCSYAYLGTPNFIPLLFYYILLCAIVAIVLDKRWVVVATSFSTMFLTGLRLENIRIGQNMVQAGIAYTLTGIIVIVLVVWVPAHSQAALLMAQNKKLDDARKQSLEAQENERRRLGMELHDDGLAKIHSLLRLVEGNEELTREQLKQVQELTRQTEKSVRNTTRNLYATDLDKIPFDSAIASLAQRECLKAGLELNLTMDESLYGKRFAKQIENTIYRVVQQSLANTVRHAQATEFEMCLLWDKKRELLHLKLADNGVGFELPASGDFRQFQLENHFGLAGIERRVRDVHGSFAIDTAPGAGTQIKIAVPALTKLEFEGS